MSYKRHLKKINTKINRVFISKKKKNSKPSLSVLQLYSEKKEAAFLAKSNTSFLNFGAEINKKRKKYLLNHDWNQAVTLIFLKESS